VDPFVVVVMAAEEEEEEGINSVEGGEDGRGAGEHRMSHDRQKDEERSVFSTTSTQSARAAERLAWKTG
jgi:hypothetical protein